MNLDLFNNILNNVKESNFIQNFMKELSNYMDSLKQEDCLYQVVELGADGVYLQNINNNKVARETDISKEVLDKIGEDFVLRYQNGEYVIEEELTRKFFDSLVGIKEYNEIRDNFVKESNILEIEPNTRYKVEEKDKDYCILSYGDEKRNTINVPNELIPFWANSGENLYYKNGKFNRDV